MTNYIQIEKKLSANDIGENNTHQAGVLIPKSAEFIRFFPLLNSSSYNPRSVIDFVDDAGKEWSFNFIYYNSRLLGKGTRNEYRLTGMTAFFREHSLKSNDILILKRKGGRSHEITYRRSNDTSLALGRIRIGLGSWKLVEFDHED